eukprot:GEZU01012036.1.p1 GENE.GEZU01012036.1~~GEZU01012036.1.p1  ORF type:complete len:427 (+),score=65.07 GEZU01012036.1:254-1534(+)
MFDFVIRLSIMLRNVVRRFDLSGATDTAGTNSSRKKASLIIIGCSLCSSIILALIQRRKRRNTREHEKQRKLGAKYPTQRITAKMPSSTESPSPAKSQTIIHADGAAEASTGTGTSNDTGNLHDPEALKFFAKSIRGRRPEQEDNYCIIPNADNSFSYFGVFDGHGGSECSALAAEQLHLYIQKDEAVSHDLETALHRSIMKLNQYFLKTPHSSGSTAVVACIRGKELLVANVGDSRAVLCSTNGCEALTIDHKPDLPRERQRIEQRGGCVGNVFGVWRVNYSLAMTRALGDKYLYPIVDAEPEIIKRELSLDDEFLILATDGVWDVIENEEACEIVRHAANAEEAAQSLVSTAFKKGSMDNTTAIVVDLREYVRKLYDRVQAQGDDDQEEEDQSESGPSAAQPTPLTTTTSTTATTTTTTTNSKL